MLNERVRLLNASFLRSRRDFRSLIVLLILFVAGCSQVAQPEKAATEPFTPISTSLHYKPLTLPEDRSATTRFEIVADCGIEFENHLKRQHHLKLVETGSGVAIGDYDDDGLADVYLLSTDGPNRLYRGRPDFRFQDVTKQAGVDGAVNGTDVWGAGATFADIDNDGDLDLFVCNMRARNLLYVNQGDGTFIESAESAGIAYCGASKVGSFCDYDHDGDLDLYLLTNQDNEPTQSIVVRLVNGLPTVHPDEREYYDIIDGHVTNAGEADILYRNNGDGSFKDVSDNAGIAGYDLGLSVTWFDFDGDGWQDIYVGNDFKTPDHLYRNEGNGTFTDVIGQLTHHTPWFSMGADSGDLNNDGLIDMMIADMSGSTHYKQKVNMGDMSDSGWFLTYGHPRQYMRNCLFANTGAGRFIDLAFMAGLDSTDWTWSVRIADLDNDGLSDVFVTTGHNRDSNNSDVALDLNAKSKTHTKSELEELRFNIPPLLEENLAFKNKGDFEFEPVGTKWNLNLNGISHGTAFADFDRDGDLDIVVNNLKRPATVYRNLSGGGNRLLVQLQGVTSNHFGVGATVKIWHGDQHQTKTLIPVRGYISSDEPILHFGLGDHQIDRLQVTWPGGAVQEFADLEVNRHYKIVEAGTIPSNNPLPDSSLFVDATRVTNLAFVHRENGFDDYKREPLLPYQLSRLGPGVAWGDVNRDGYPDAYLGGAASQAGRLFINVDGAKFVVLDGPWNGDAGSEDMGCILFDADGDDDDDLYVVSGSNEFEAGSELLMDRLYLNDGGKFSKAAEGVLPKLTDSGSCVAAADFDKDGDLDLFVGSRSIPGKYPLTPNSRLLENQGGKFVDVTLESAEGLQQIGMVNGAIWSDSDGDGWLDLMLAIDWGPIVLFQNRQGTLVNATRDAGLAQKTGWWHALAAGDFDGDGDLDYVAANHGLNTKYHTDPKHPHRIYYYDFDQNGTMDLVEAEFEGTTEFPVRGRSCSSHCMPFIAEKFQTFHEFAIADLAGIYSTDISERPFLEVTTLESAVLWNHGKDGFEFQSLPRLAQSSPCYGVAVVDADGDGNLDILLVNNFFGSQPETGYMDGGLGLLLKGDGKRGFHAMWPRESGVVLPNDSTSIALADFDRDGDMDALVGVNNGPAQLLRCETNSERDRQE